MVHKTRQDHQFPLMFIYCLIMDISVLFLSDLEPPRGHLVLNNTNSLQYNLATPNPTSLFMATPITYRSNHNLDPSPLPTHLPIVAQAPSQQLHSHTTGVKNYRDDTILLLPLDCNLHA